MMQKSIPDFFLPLLKDTTDQPIPVVLQSLCDAFPNSITFSTSFSKEDQVILHLIQQQRLPVAVFTLDTGRLFAETYTTWSRTNERYSIKIKAYYPQAATLEQWVEENGPNAFYNSVEQRKECCYLRKVEPLKRALLDKKVWITGLRAEHSPTRQNLSVLEWDEGNEIIKFNPLLFWTSDEVDEYILSHNIPYNALHDRGFISIGCAPCTRAVKEGEDFRAGRWWWEEASKKECGLHVAAKAETKTY